MRDATRRQALGTGLGAGIVLAAAAASSPGAALARIEGLAADPVGFALALGAVYLLRPLFAWPISGVSVLVGYVYGIEIGIPVALVGAVFTCLPPFAVARHASSDAGLFGWISRSADRVVEVTGATRGVFAARMAPLPADVISYAAGFSGIPAGAFLAGTVLGEIPWVVAAVVAGSSMRTLTVGGAGPGNATAVVVGAAALATLLLARPAYRHFGSDAT